jgi:hypothetical protein
MRASLVDDLILYAASFARRLATGRRRCVAGRGLEEIIMFVRQVRAHFKPEKFDLFNKRFEKEVIPMLQKQKGFRDELSFFDKLGYQGICRQVCTRPLPNNPHEDGRYAQGYAAGSVL